MFHPAQFRVARPTDRMPELLRFYRDGLDLEVLGSFRDHAGFDGIMLGHQSWPYHLEFTHHPGHPAARAPTADNLVVFYLPDAQVWQAAVERMKAHGFPQVPSLNPYWDLAGKTFEDPDGYRVVLQRGTWP